MSIVSEPGQWKLRTLGAALGAGFSAVVGVLLIWTGIGFYAGLVGIPAGAIAGAIYAPRLARVPKPARSIVRAAWVACLLGIAGHMIVLAIAAALGPMTPWYAALAGLAFFAVAVAITGFVVGFPVALVVAWLATWSGRRVAEQADRVWLPAVVAALAMAALTGFQAVRLMGLTPY
jgi:hypothetical protein